MIECVNKKVAKDKKWQEVKDIQRNLKIQQYN